MRFRMLGPEEKLLRQTNSLSKIFCASTFLFCRSVSHMPAQQCRGFWSYDGPKQCRGFWSYDGPNLLEVMGLKKRGP